MEIRRNHYVYDITPACTYPRMKVIPELKRNGFKGEFHNTLPFDLFCELLKNNQAETLIKTGQYSLLSYFIRNASKSTATYWNAIRIATRNGYMVSDAGIWCDYIDLLRYFGKDTNSPKYICPTDLRVEHDRLVRKKTERMERERIEEQKHKALENEQRFQKLKGSSSVSPLRTVQSKYGYWKAYWNFWKRERPCTIACIPTNTTLNRTPSSYRQPLTANG